MTWSSVSDLSSAQLDDLYELFQNEWWTTGRTPDEIARMVAHSDEIIGLIDSDTDALVAFARILTDYTYKALIFDVIVAPQHRDLGLGARVMEELVTHNALTEVDHFELYCLDEMIEFYERWGFASDLGGLQILRRDHTNESACEST